MILIGSPKLQQIKGKFIEIKAKFFEYHFAFDFEFSFITNFFLWSWNLLRTKSLVFHKQDSQIFYNYTLVVLCMKEFPFLISQSLLAGLRRCSCLYECLAGARQWRWHQVGSHPGHHEEFWLNFPKKMWNVSMSKFSRIRIHEAYVHFRAWNYMTTHFYAILRIVPIIILIITRNNK